MPAKAIARAKVPSSTTNFNTGSLNALSIVMMTLNTSTPPPSMYHVLALIAIAVYFRYRFEHSEREKQRIKRQLTENAAHELKTPAVD